MTQESVAVPARPIALVVDDEPLILLDTSDIVMDAGYQVVEANTADQALAYLETHAVFDLLVTDIQMLGSMDGIALARYVGERWSFPHRLGSLFHIHPSRRGGQHERMGIGSPYP
jgi:response regulator RpfG family c-di-GMP phosphodiesterase